MLQVQFGLLLVQGEAQSPADQLAWQVATVQI